MLIAEHISVRLWMRDLFLGCVYVRTYVCMCQSTLGMSICTHVQELRHHWYVNYMKTSRQRFLAMHDEGGSTAGLCNICIWQSQMGKWVLNAANSWRLWEKKRAKSQSTVEAKRAKREQGKVESMYWRVFTSQVLVQATVVLYCSLGFH